MSKPDILIIDDEEQICINLKEMLKYENYDADFALTAKETFHKLEQDSFRLLLVDIKLGGAVTGIEIIKTFREREKRPKIIVVSAIPLDALDPIFEKEGITHLIDGFIGKPSCSDPSKLVGLVRKVLG